VDLLVTSVSAMKSQRCRDVDGRGGGREHKERQEAQILNSADSLSESYIASESDAKSKFKKAYDRPPNNKRKPRNE